MIDNETQAVTPPATGPILQPSLQPWVSPSFERLSLSEAMGAIPNHIAADGPNTYS